jgi:hypothetical protein
MKITKRQLRRIIKEEKRKLHEERPGREQRMKAFVDLLQAAEDYADLTGLENAIDQLQIIIDDLKDELERSETDEEF